MSEIKDQRAENGDKEPRNKGLESEGRWFDAVERSQGLERECLGVFGGVDAPSADSWSDLG